MCFLKASIILNVKVVPNDFSDLAAKELKTYEKWTLNISINDRDTMNKDRCLFKAAVQYS